MDVRLKIIGGKNAGQEIKLPGAKFLIGRAEGCHLRPNSDQISRQHCEIAVAEGNAVARDMGSRNGTLVNGEKIEGPTVLKTGDHLKVGPLEFEVVLTTDLAKKKAPKVESIKQAAARTAETGSKQELDIEQWLMEGGENVSQTRAMSTDDTQAGQDTPGAANDAGLSFAKRLQAAKSKEPKPKDSREAAAQMLKKFFNNEGR